jgi:hypothetical protein
LLEVTACAAAVRWIFEPELWRAASRRTRVSIVLGLASLLGVEATRRDHREAFLLVAVLASAAAFRFTRARRGGADWLALSWGLLLANFALGPLLRVPLHSSLLNGGDASLRGLEVWMRERSPKDALFLTPPEEPSLRLLGERSIVVDWKSPPALPNEVLEWYRRVGDVVGRSDVRGEKDLEGYARLDPARLEALRRRYGFDFAVIRREHTEPFAAYPRAFENGEFVVLRMNSGLTGGERATRGLDLAPD